MPDAHAQNVRAILVVVVQEEVVHGGQFFQVEKVLEEKVLELEIEEEHSEGQVPREHRGEEVDEAELNE